MTIAKPGDRFEAWWLEPVEDGDEPHVKARKLAVAQDGCIYPVEGFEETILCLAPCVPGERYCDEHIQRVCLRTNRDGVVMPDDPRAAWMQK